MKFFKTVASAGVRGTPARSHRGMWAVALELEGSSFGTEKKVCTTYKRPLLRRYSIIGWMPKDVPFKADLARNIGECSFAEDAGGGGAKVPPGGRIVGNLDLSHEW